MDDLSTMKLAECIDLAYNLRAKRLEAERQVEAMKAEEMAVKEHIISRFTKDDIASARGHAATASVSPVTIPHVTDSAAFYEYVRANDAFDMLERRPSRAAFKARLENNEQVPGVEPMVVVNLSLTKVG
jgi:hypothetical protein